MTVSRSLEETLSELVGAILFSEVDPDALGADLQNDYGANSMDVVDIVEQVETQFDVLIPNKDIERIVTFGDLVQYVSSAIHSAP